MDTHDTEQPTVKRARRTEQRLAQGEQVSEADAQRAQNAYLLSKVIELEERLIVAEGVAPATTAHARTEDEKLLAELESERARLVAKFKDYPAIQALSTRFAVGEDASTDIRLIGDPSPQDDPLGTKSTWHLRWFDLGREGRAQQMASHGYVRVQWEELQNQESVIGDRTQPFVRRGDRGHEILAKIPKELYAFKQRQDAARRRGVYQSESKLVDHMAERTAKRAGAVGDNADQAGQFIADNKQFVTITEAPSERVTL